MLRYHLPRTPTRATKSLSLASLSPASLLAATLAFAIACAAAASLMAIGCAPVDDAPPLVTAAEFLEADGEPTPVPLWSPADLLEGLTALREDPASVSEPRSGAALPVLPPRGSVRFACSEPLDGDSAQMAVRDPDSGQVTRLLVRHGVFEAGTAEGEWLAADASWDPALQRLRAHLRGSGTAWLPTGSVVFVHLLAGKVWDPDRNGIPTARDASGEPVTAPSGAPIAASLAFRTEPLRVTGRVFPDYGAVDDPETPADESVPWDAPLTVTFNAPVNPASAEGLVTVRSASGDDIAVAFSASDDAPDALLVSPRAPLVPGTGYALRVDAGVKDRFGGASAGDSLLVPFSTREEGP